MLCFLTAALIQALIFPTDAKCSAECQKECLRTQNFEECGQLCCDETEDFYPIKITLNPPPEALQI